MSAQDSPSPEPVSARDLTYCAPPGITNESEYRAYRREINGIKRMGAGGGYSGFFVRARRT